MILKERTTNTGLRIIEQKRCESRSDYPNELTYEFSRIVLEVTQSSFVHEIHSSPRLLQEAESSPTGKRIDNSRASYPSFAEACTTDSVIPVFKTCLRRNSPAA